MFAKFTPERVVGSVKDDENIESKRSINSGEESSAFQREFRSNKSANTTQQEKQRKQKPVLCYLLIPASKIPGLQKLLESVMVL